MEFEPRSISFHIAFISVVGGGTFGMDTAAPELEATFRTRDGSHGTVSVQLDADERAFLTEIVKSASKRAMSLVGESGVVAAQKGY